MVRVQEFFDTMTSTLTYVVWDAPTRSAIVIDPVLDYDPASSKVGRESIEKLIAFVEKEGLTLHYILETHAHADHLSGAQVLKERFPKATLAIGKRITEVQTHFKKVFELPDSFPTNGSQFDRLLQDRETLTAGSLTIEVLATPGHTPSCLSYRIGDTIFTGDTLFMPDYGVGRCDFPSGSAKDLYESITKRLYTLPDQVRVFTGHDYLPNGRPLRFESTIGEQKRANIHLNAQSTEQAFVKLRTERDKTLKPPKLFSPSLPVNIDGGRTAWLEKR